MIFTDYLPLKYFKNPTNILIRDKTKLLKIKIRNKSN